MKEGRWGEREREKGTERRDEIEGRGRGREIIHNNFML